MTGPLGEADRADGGSGPAEARCTLNVAAASPPLAPSPKAKQNNSTSGKKKRRSKTKGLYARRPPTPTHSAPAHPSARPPAGHGFSPILPPAGGAGPRPPRADSSAPSHSPGRPFPQGSPLPTLLGGPSGLALPAVCPAGSQPGLSLYAFPFPVSPLPLHLSLPPSPLASLSLPQPCSFPPRRL